MVVSRHVRSRDWPQNLTRDTQCLKHSRSLLQQMPIYTDKYENKSIQRRLGQTSLLIKKKPFITPLIKRQRRQADRISNNGGTSGVFHTFFFHRHDHYPKTRTVGKRENNYHTALHDVTKVSLPPYFLRSFCAP